MRFKEMGVINVKISDETESEFRMELSKRKGYKKGAMGEAIEESLINWILRPVWVNDVPEQNVNNYIEIMRKENKELEYFSGEAVKDKRPGYVGMYYRLKTSTS